MPEAFSLLCKLAQRGERQVERREGKRGEREGERREGKRGERGRKDGRELKAAYLRVPTTVGFTPKQFTQGLPGLR